MFTILLALEEDLAGDLVAEVAVAPALVPEAVEQVAREKIFMEPI